MDSQKVDMFIMTNAKLFESTHLHIIRERMLSIDDSKWGMIAAANLKDPSTIFIVSLLCGGLGIDRFMIGDTGIGVAKLLTLGGCGIWSIIDLFLISGATRAKNFEKIQPYLY
jgi:TM2 domain-containing membrane protein YozV